MNAFRFGMLKHVATMAVLVLPGLTLQTACRGRQGASQVAYLTEKDYQCHDPGSERLDAVRAKLPDGFVRDYPDSQSSVILNRLALLPDRDLDYLVSNYKSGILQGITPGGNSFLGVAGVTTLSAGTSPAGNRYMIARSITTGVNQVGFAMQHEVGHAVEVLGADAAMRTSYSDFGNAMRQLQSELSSTPGVRGYAESSPNEAWAEAYANFYCSQESHAFIKDNLKFAYPFLLAVLEPPQWELAAEPSAQGSDLPRGRSTGRGDDLSQAARAAPAAEDAGAANNPFRTFLDRVVELLGQKTGTATAKKNNDGASLIVRGASRDLTIALADEQEPSPTTIMVLSTAPKVVKVLLCIGTASTCALPETKPKSVGNMFLFTEFRQGSRRNFFDVKNIGSDQEAVFAAEWHLGGYDKDGQLIATRSLKVVAKDK